MPRTPKLPGVRVPTTATTADSYADGRRFQTRMAIINASSGLIGAALGAGVALIVALTQLNAQGDQLDRQATQTQLSFLRDRRIDVYSELLSTYDELRTEAIHVRDSPLLLRGDGTQVDRQELRGYLLKMLDLLDRADDLAIRTQLLGPTEAAQDVYETNQAYGLFVSAAERSLRGRSDIEGVQQNYSQAINFRDQFARTAQRVIGTDLT